MKNLSLVITITLSIYLATSSSPHARQSIHLVDQTGWLSGLPLSQAQQQDLALIRQQLKQTNALYANERITAKHEIQALLATPIWDEQKALSLVNTFIDTRLVIEANNAFARHQALSLLSTAQINAIKNNRKDKRLNDDSKPLMAVAKRLNLSSEQKRKAREIFITQQQALTQYKTDKIDHRRAERALIQSADFKRSDYISLNQAFADTEKAIMMIRLKTRYNILQLLNDEQKAKYAKLQRKKKYS